MKHEPDAQAVDVAGKRGAVQKRRFASRGVQLYEATAGEQQQVFEARYIQTFIHQ